MGTYINPLDLKTLIVDYFLGSQELFIYLFVIAVSWACAKYQMPNRLYFTILPIGSIMFAVYLGQAIYVLIIFMIGILSFKGIARMFAY